MQQEAHTVAISEYVLCDKCWQLQLLHRIKNLEN